MWLSELKMEANRQRSHSQRFQRAAELFQWTAVLYNSGSSWQQRAQGPGEARGSQEEPSRAKRSHEEQWGARRSQEEPGGARRSHEEPRETRRGQAEPGRARRSQEEPGELPQQRNRAQEMCGTQGCYRFPRGLKKQKCAIRRQRTTLSLFFLGHGLSPANWFQISQTD